MVKKYKHKKKSNEMACEKIRIITEMILFYLLFILYRHYRLLDRYQNVILTNEVRCMIEKTNKNSIVNV